ncbi:MAG: tail fiber domain-containing protein, partial [Candidatus Kapaibacteriales bacterium]
QFVARFAGGYYFYTNAGMSVGVYVDAGGSSWSSISDSTKKTDFLKADGEIFLQKLRTMRLGSWRFKWDPVERRHYGPMAQEFFALFGRDGHGTIGNDTTLATADVDGVVFILLQALEARTNELREKTKEIITLKQENQELMRRLEKLEKFVFESNSDENQTLGHRND